VTVVLFALMFRRQVDHLDCLEKVIGKGSEQVIRVVCAQALARRMMQVHIAEQFAERPLLVPLEPMPFESRQWSFQALMLLSDHKAIPPKQVPLRALPAAFW